jgi:hypothetical protein
MRLGHQPVRGYGHRARIKSHPNTSELHSAANEPPLTLGSPDPAGAQCPSIRCARPQVLNTQVVWCGVKRRRLAASKSWRRYAAGFMTSAAG